MTYLEEVKCYRIRNINQGLLWVDVLLVFVMWLLSRVSDWFVSKVCILGPTYIEEDL